MSDTSPNPARSPAPAGNDARPLPRLASTVVLLRDGEEGLETLLIRRHGASGFMAGASVFPGGKVDDFDARCDLDGATPATCAAALELQDETLATALFVAAVREVHEEAGVLLARNAKGQLPDGATSDALRDALGEIREGHRIEAAKVHGLWRTHGWRPAVDLLVPMAWWVTPKVEPRRFDTRFFVALLPPGQQPQCDGFEGVSSRWISPHRALAAHHEGGEVYLPPPTLHTLERLAGFHGSAAEALAQLQARGLGPRIEPHFVGRHEGGPVIALPDDPLHPAHRGAADERNRFVLRNGRFVREQRGASRI